MTHHPKKIAVPGKPGTAQNRHYTGRDEAVNRTASGVEHGNKKLGSILENSFQSHFAGGQGNNLTRLMRTRIILTTTPASNSAFLNAEQLCAMRITEFLNVLG